MKRSKNYKKISNSMNKASDLRSYLEIACQTNPYKFDQSIELKIAIKKSTKNATPYKVSVTYPNNFGKNIKILVFAEQDDAKKAIEAGADYAGLDEYINKIANEVWLDFDVVIATPAVMPQIARLGRFLGAKGLMPNPKTGTVVSDVETAVKEFKSGRKNFKEDKTGVINTVVAKVSQGPEKAIENIKTLVDALKEVNQNLEREIKSIHIKTTMGPSMKLSTLDLINL